MIARGLLLAAASLSLASVCTQFTRTNTFPYSGNSYIMEYSSGFTNSYSSYPIRPDPLLSVSPQQNVNQLPTFEFLNPSGLRMTIPGPYPQSQVYVMKFHININREFNGVKRGQWNEDVNIPTGSQWAHTFPTIRLRQGDTIYYWVEVKGKQGFYTWFREYDGFYQVPLPNPHSSQNSALTPVYKPPEPEGTSSGPSVVYEYPQQPIATVPNYYGPQNSPLPPTNKPQEPGVSSSDVYRPFVYGNPQQPLAIMPNPYSPPNSPPTPSNEPREPGRSPSADSNTFRSPNISSRDPLPNKPQVPPSTVDPSSFYPIAPTEKADTRGQCRPSSTVFNNGQKPCAGEFFVNKFHFDSIIQIAGYEPEEAFTVFSKDSITRIDHGYRNTIDTITPSFLVDKYGPRSQDKSLTLSDCTSTWPELCSKHGMGYFILPPIISGRETTENTLSFCYGVLEVTAKLPKGDWIVPELWLVPKNQGDRGSSGRIVLAKSVGNSALTNGVQDFSNRVLEAGVQYGNGQQMMFKKVQSRPWSDSYHKFKLVWSPDLIMFYVDDQEIGHVHQEATTKSKLKPFDQECYLVFGVHVGGDKDFPDNLVGKPWKNKEQKNKLNFWRDNKKWSRTWTEDRSLIIHSISLTALNQ